MNWVATHEKSEQWAYCEQGSKAVISLQLMMIWLMWIFQAELCTHHFIRNINSPLLSVAPMMRSGSRFLANPRGFSACRWFKNIYGIKFHNAHDENVLFEPGLGSLSKKKFEFTTIYDNLHTVVHTYSHSQLLAVDPKDLTKRTHHIFLLSIRLRLIYRCLPLHRSHFLLDVLLRFQKRRDQLWTIQVLFRLPGVVSAKWAESRHWTFCISKEASRCKQYNRLLVCMQMCSFVVQPHWLATKRSTTPYQGSASSSGGGGGAVPGNSLCKSFPLQVEFYFSIDDTLVQNFLHDKLFGFFLRLILLSLDGLLLAHVVL